MKKLQSSPLPLFFVFLFFFVSQTHAQIWGLGKSVKGNGQVQTESRNVDSFDEISVSAGIDVYFKEGNQSVEVTADENILEFIETKVKGNQLHIGRKNNAKIKNATKMEVWVTAPELYSVSTSSGASFQAKDEVSTTKMNLSASSGSDLMMNARASKMVIKCSSGADIDADIESDDIDVSVSSGADIILSGSADHAKISASSGGDVEAYKLQLKTCYASASSAGGVNISVSDSLEANASSGGDVNYKGSPNVDKSTSSGGDVSKN